ncbi:MAG: polyphenol oxidase family protein [Spirochaetia bacterium]|nr:polyphenol oxidase family protein [Spirochaetia bacterium]
MNYHLEKKNSYIYNYNSVSYNLDVWGRSNTVLEKKITVPLEETDVHFIKDEYKNSNMRFLKQVHGTNGFLLPKKEMSNVFWGEADFAYTETESLPVIVRTADCIPILFWHPDFSLCGAIHAGWRGLHQNILTVVIQKLKEKYEEKQIKKLCFFVGPFIAENSYEVEKDTYSKFDSNFSKDSHKKNKKLLNLKKILINQFLEIKISKDSIIWNDIDTFNSSEFFSHRCGHKERNIFLIYIKNIK